ncbi:MAG TPA: molybdopterin dinucleotide binding domain-containing protein, partial [Holophagaceae bacterium]|nr:molybdopterin dinucleotide binding domain-containing protein [Holophagaceae bacterium]
GFEKEFSFADAEAVWNEVRDLWPAVRGISYARLEAGGLQWPCPDETHPGTAILHASAFPMGPRASFRALGYRPSAEQADEAFPFILNTGRTLYHFNAATMTGRSRNQELEPDDWVQIHPDDAGELDLANRDRIRVETRHGAFEGQAWLSDGVRRGELFAVFHNPAAFVNRATGVGRDSISGTPEYKVTAARLRRG